MIETLGSFFFWFKKNEFDHDPTAVFKEIFSEIKDLST